MKIESLQKVILAMAEARELSVILEEIVRGVRGTFDLALARLWLLETDEECPLCRTSPEAKNQERALHLRSSAGESARNSRKYNRLTGSFHRIRVGQLKIGQIAQTGKAMLIPKITGEEEWISNREWIQAERIKAFAGHPLTFKGEILGVIGVFSRSPFSQEEFSSLRTFADHAAVAIANAKAFEELERLKKRLQAENEYLQEEIKGTLHFGEIVGRSSALAKVLEQVALVAATGATVLIEGESGTGKELIARAIHDQSPRRDRPFIKVNCGAIAEQLFESEFFGHAKGAFTGAIKDRVGRFELAHSGDLFLDEIGEIPVSLQAKLLRVLQEKQFERVGEGRTRTVDVRLIAATNRDLKADVENGRFREDLYYRLTVFPVHLPPLRARKDDIPPLAEHFLKKSSARLRTATPRLTRENLRQLQDYNWPGNIRELENVVERASILAQHSGRLTFDLGKPARATASQREKSNVENAAAASGVLTKEQLRKQEVDNIMAALQQTNGRIFGPAGAAKILGMRPTTLASRLKALGITKGYSIPA